MSDSVTQPEVAIDEQDILKIRREKLAEMREAGEAFPNDFSRKDYAADVLDAFDEQSKEDLEALKQTVTVAGRLMLRRVMGKASFIHLQDMTGRIQVYVRRDDLPEGVYQSFKKWDIGDIVGAEGVLFKTKTGELSIHASEIRLLTKSLRPLPEKFHGLSDTEQRYRQRYLDLMMNEDTRKVFDVRSRLILAMRQYLRGKRFTEVETPMMQPIPGGGRLRVRSLRIIIP